MVILVFLRNPVSAFIVTPALSWLLIGDRHGPRHGLGKILYVALYLLGGLFLYVFIYFVGVTISAERLGALWYGWLELSTQTVDFWSASLIFAVVAAGLALLADPSFGGRLDSKDEPLASQPVPAAEEYGEAGEIDAPAISPGTDSQGSTGLQATNR